jgi:ribosomal protein S27AE
MSHRRCQPCGRLVWLREDLDRWLDGRRGSLPAPENLDPFLEI